MHLGLKQIQFLINVRITECIRPFGANAFVILGGITAWKLHCRIFDKLYILQGLIVLQVC